MLNRPDRSGGGHRLCGEAAGLQACVVGESAGLKPCSYSSLLASGMSVALAPRVTITVCGQGVPDAAYSGDQGVGAQPPRPVGAASFSADRCPAAPRYYAGLRRCIVEVASEVGQAQPAQVLVLVHAVRRARLTVIEVCPDQSLRAEEWGVRSIVICGVKHQYRDTRARRVTSRRETVYP